MLEIEKNYLKKYVSVIISGENEGFSEKQIILHKIHYVQMIAQRVLCDTS